MFPASLPELLSPHIKKSAHISVSSHSTGQLEHALTEADIHGKRSCSLRVYVTDQVRPSNFVLQTVRVKQQHYHLSDGKRHVLKAAAAVVSPITVCSSHHHWVAHIYWYWCVSIMDTIIRLDFLTGDRDRGAKVSSWFHEHFSYADGNVALCNCGVLVFCLSQCFSSHYFC